MRQFLLNVIHLAPFGAAIVVGLLLGVAYVGSYDEGFRDGFIEGEASEHRTNEVLWRARQDWIEELERTCADRCAQHGHPSLNAFYSIDRDACMCQERGASDDTHGFLILRPSAP